MISIFLADDHEVVRRGIAELLTADPDLIVVGEAASYSQALARTPRSDPMSPCSTSVYPMETESSCVAN